MKKLFLLLLSLGIMILLLTSCDSGQTDNIDEISFVDVLTSYDDESIYIPDKNENSNTTETPLNKKARHLTDSHQGSSIILCLILISHFLTTSTRSNSMNTTGLHIQNM